MVEQEVIERRRLLKAGSPSDYFQCEKREVLCEGTTRSAKTFSVMLKVNNTARMYPGSRQVICRQTRKSLNESVLKDWRSEVLWQGHEAISPTASKEHQDLYVYKNGSEVGRSTNRSSATANQIWGYHAHFAGTLAAGDTIEPYATGSANTTIKGTIGTRLTVHALP